MTEWILGGAWVDGQRWSVHQNVQHHPTDFGMEGFSQLSPSHRNAIQHQRHILCQASRDSTTCAKTCSFFFVPRTTARKLRTD